MRVAGTTGLEPATSDVTGRRSNQLNYVPAAYFCRIPQRLWFLQVGMRLILWPEEEYAPE
jgi:hypothetical protein